MSNEPCDILIIGFGAVGTIYGYILSQNENVRVTAIARSSYSEMNEKGITIESEKFGVIEGWKPSRIVKDAAEANDRSYKYIICCFKCLPDLLPSASVLSPFLESRFAEDSVPTIVLIQNGIGIEHPVQVAYPHVPIISCVAWIGANLKPGPRVTHGMLEKLIIGLYLGEGIHSPANPLSGESEDDYGDPAGYKTEGGEARKENGLRRTEAFAALLQNGGGEVEVAQNIQASRYRKQMWNAAWSSICTLSRSTVPAVVAPEVLPFTLPVVRRTMLEVLYVARAWGYDESALPMKSVDDAIKITIKNYQRSSGPTTPATPGTQGDASGKQGHGSPDSEASSFQSPDDFKPSMLLDVEAGRPSELEPIIGSVLDRARAKGVATPRLDLVYASLKVNQDMAVRRSADDPAYKEHIANWLQRKPAVGGAGLDGRKAWEKAVKLGMMDGDAPKVGMAGGKDKVRGKPVNLATDTDDE